MHKLTFTLKQHTPIIHFQHNQHGATLRATELKPKLDKFLIDNLDLTEIIQKDGKDIRVPKRNYANWFNNKKKLSLDYKVRITDSNSKDYFLPISFVSLKNKNATENCAKQALGLSNLNILAPCPYFANNEKISKEKWDEVNIAVQSQSFITVTIICFISELKNEIIKLFPDLLFTTNFGSRQNKGFGSYSVTKVNENKVTFIEKELYNYFEYVLKVNTKKDGDINYIFKTIDNLYKDIKNNGATKKSHLKDSQKETWEKEIVRDKLIENKQSKPLKLVLENSPKYIRAVLGLAEIYSYPHNDDKKVKIKNNPENKEEKDIITRYQSPLYFKVIENNIYILSNGVNPAILNESFIFEEGSPNNRIILKTPESFNDKDFFNYLTSNDNRLTLITPTT